MRKLGVVGSLVWDVIHGRDPRTAPVEEWGGIAYALSSLDAHLPEGWEIVPLIKVGSDLHAPAERFLLPDGSTFGIIASTTQPFCASCDRSRLTADGRWLAPVSAK